MKNIYFGIVAAGLALLASSCGKSSSSIAPIVTAQSAGPVFYPSNDSEYADFLGAGVLQSLPTTSSKLVPITIAPTSGASIVSLKVSSSNPTVATVTADGNKLGGNYWNFEVWPQSIGKTSLTLLATGSDGVESQVTLTYTVVDKPQVTTNLSSNRLNLSGSSSRRCTVVSYKIQFAVKSFEDPSIFTDSTNSSVATVSISGKTSDDGLTKTYEVSGASIKAGTANLSFTFTNAYGTTTKTIGVTRTC